MRQISEPRVVGIDCNQAQSTCQWTEHTCMCAILYMCYTHRPEGINGENDSFRRNSYSSLRAYCTLAAGYRLQHSSSNDKLDQAQKMGSKPKLLLSDKQCSCHRKGNLWYANSLLQPTTQGPSPWRASRKAPAVCTNTAQEYAATLLQISTRCTVQRSTVWCHGAQ